MMNNMEEGKDHIVDELDNFIENIAYMVAEIIETRDPYLMGHHQRVSKLTTAIAQEINLPPG